MLKSMITRLRQGYRTMGYPAGAPPAMPDRFRGAPLVTGGKCPPGCRACVEACPAAAIDAGRAGGGAGGAAGDGGQAFGPRIDLGKCLFCADCVAACPAAALRHAADHRLATSRREDLLLGPGDEGPRLAAALEGETRRLFGRSLKLRQVSAGGCNACEADVNVLGTIGWDLGRFGIQMVASPRHADGLLVTGPVTRNMELALRKTWDAVAEPKILVAVGACAISGGLYAGNEEAGRGVEGLLPVKLYVPGCPPHPLSILDGLLRMLRRIR